MLEANNRPHDMLHKDMDVYVDEMISKFMTEPEKGFWTGKKYDLKLNPNKSVFGSTFDKLLGSIQLAWNCN